jgi:ADP-ribosylglycohydrolase
MRTAPVALAFLDDPEGLTQAAGEISALTHADPEAGEACVLLCHAIRQAVLTGRLDLWVGLPVLPVQRQDVWARRFEAAERGRPQDFRQNGWVVEALQGAWSAVSMADPSDPVRTGLEAAVLGGHDTDTVAAIAGALLGAGHGASAVPVEWVEILHGWPGRRAEDLVAAARAIVGHNHALAAVRPSSPGSGAAHASGPGGVDRDADPVQRDPRPAARGSVGTEDEEARHERHE